MHAFANRLLMVLLSDTSILTHFQLLCIRSTTNCGLWINADRALAGSMHPALPGNTKMQLRGSWTNSIFTHALIILGRAFISRLCLIMVHLPLSLAFSTKQGFAFHSHSHKQPMQRHLKIARNTTQLLAIQ